MSVLEKILPFIALPGAISDFERRYLARMNRIGLGFFALHLPVFVVIAFLNDTGPLSAGLLTLAVLAGPTLAYLFVDNPRTVGLTYGVTAMLMGGLLVHVGQGPVQIEMHFYFFALIAMLAVYANPMIIVVAAATVALHHLLLWLVLPASVFNYEAPIWVVLVHAAFVVLESVATCFVARSFFDNVIGLERIVEARTRELDDRNRDLRLVLDNVAQGFLTIDTAGVLSSEYSAIVERWLGKPAPRDTLESFLRRSSPAFADELGVAWAEVVEDVMPLELTLHQMPARLDRDGRHLRFTYLPIMSGAALSKLLVVITDETEAVAREKLEAEQRESLAIFDRIMRDKAGFLEFFEEADEHVETVVRGRFTKLGQLKRVLHTLKGNAMIFGIQTVADHCHRMETTVVEEGESPGDAAREELRARWERLRRDLDTLLGNGRRTTIEIDDADYRRLLGAVANDAPRAALVQMVSEWRMEPTATRLARVAEQARGIARRLNHGDLRVVIEDGALLLDPRPWAAFWSSFVHVVRNALDHGIESADERRTAGKSAEGTLALRTRVEEDSFVVEIEDDGRGIDWRAVASRAAALGVPCAGEEDLVHALYVDGMTTRADVTEFSGRGVGMGAVRAACRELDGHMEVHSTPGSGTRVTFRFPRAAMASCAQAGAIAA